MCQSVLETLYLKIKITLKINNLNDEIFILQFLLIDCTLKKNTFSSY